MKRKQQTHNIALSLKDDRDDTLVSGALVKPEQSEPITSYYVSADGATCDASAGEPVEGTAPAGKSSEGQSGTEGDGEPELAGIFDPRRPYGISEDGSHAWCSLWFGDPKDAPFVIDCSDPIHAGSWYCDGPNLRGSKPDANA